MSRLEESLLRRVSGARLVAMSIALGLAGFMPLQIYIWFGPRDGNPIGLGLLAVATLPFAGVGIAVGLIKILIDRFQKAGK